MTEFVDAWTPEEGAARARELFRTAFDAEPAGVWAAPGRVNLIGEHTDYNGGLCLPIALPHRTYAAVAPRSDRLVRLVSAQSGSTQSGSAQGADVRSVDLDAVGPVGGPGEVDGWPAYVVGVAWALREAGLVDAHAGSPSSSGFDVAIDSCVPFGAGLSSSAALESAVAVALDELWGLGMVGSDAGRATLAAACVRAENEIAGAPTGGMDQAASLRAQQGHALLLDCRDGSVRQVPFDLSRDGLELLVIDTRAPHQLVDGQYAQRRATCEQAARRLGVATLREVADLDDALARLTDDVERARVRHVVTEIGRVVDFVAVAGAGETAAGEAGVHPAGGHSPSREHSPFGEHSLSGERLAEAGRLFDASHESLRVDYEVTCPELDVAVAAAREAGAHGARMTGGGFGGSAIALIDAGHADEVAAAVADAFAEAGFNAPEFLVATAEVPAARVE